MLLSSESFPLAVCHLAAEPNRELLSDEKAKIDTSLRSSLM